MCCVLDDGETRNAKVEYLDDDEIMVLFYRGLSRVKSWSITYCFHSRILVLLSSSFFWKSMFVSGLVIKGAYISPQNV